MRRIRKIFKISVAAIAATACVFLLTACSTQHKGTVFSTGYSVTVWGSGASSGIDAAKARLLETEAELSPRVETSDVARINAAEANTPVSVSEDTVFLMKLCKTLYEETDGAFNPAIFPIVELWGFDPVGFDKEDFEQNFKVPTEAEIAALLPYTDFDDFLLDPAAKTVTKRDSKAKLDFGASAKGYAADAVGKLFPDNPDYLIVIGGSVLTGSKEKLIGVQNPFTREKIAKAFKVARAGISTSGLYERKIEKDGVLYHHILGKDGYPANLRAENPPVSVTVAAGSGVMSDILSTTGFVVGAEKFEQILKHYHSSAYLIYKDGSESFLNGIEALIDEDANVD